jgi:hypothetical protein
MPLWDNLSVSKLTHSQIQGLASLKFKLETQHYIIFSKFMDENI